MRGKVLQKVELFGCEAHFGIASLQPSRAEVDFEIIQTQDGWIQSRLRQPAQSRSNSSKKLRSGERLRHVVIGAGVQRFDLVLFGIAYGEHDDCDIGPGADDSARLDAAH